MPSPLILQAILWTLLSLLIAIYAFLQADFKAWGLAGISLSIGILAAAFEYSARQSDNIF